MPQKLDLLFNRLRDLAKAYDRLSRAVPDPSTAERDADTALERVNALLGDPEIAKVMGELIRAGHHRVLSAPEEFDADLRAKRSEIIEIETKIMRRIGAKEVDISRLYLSYERSRSYRDQFPAEVDDLKQKLTEIHNATKEHISQSRELSRKEKKKRKRKIGQGVASAIFGTGVIVADTQLPLLFAFSYGLGGGALHQALRDIVGEAAE